MRSSISCVEIVVQFNWCRFAKVRAKSSCLEETDGDRAVTQCACAPSSWWHTKEREELSTPPQKATITFSKPRTNSLRLVSSASADNRRRLQHKRSKGVNKFEKLQQINQRTNFNFLFQLKTQTSKLYSRYSPPTPFRIFLSRLQLG